MDSTDKYETKLNQCAPLSEAARAEALRGKPKADGKAQQEGVAPIRPRVCRKPNGSSLPRVVSRRDLFIVIFIVIRLRRTSPNRVAGRSMKIAIRITIATRSCRGLFAVNSVRFLRRRGIT